MARAQKKTSERRVSFCYDADRLRSFRRELTLLRLLREALGDRRHRADLRRESEHPPFFLESEYSQWTYEWSAAGRSGTDAGDAADLLRRWPRRYAAHSVGVLHKDLKPERADGHGGGWLAASENRGLWHRRARRPLEAGGRAVHGGGIHRGPVDHE